MIGNFIIWRHSFRKSSQSYLFLVQMVTFSTQNEVRQWEWKYTKQWKTMDRIFHHDWTGSFLWLQRWIRKFRTEEVEHEENQKATNHYINLSNKPNSEYGKRRNYLLKCTLYKWIFKRKSSGL